MAREMAVASGVTLEIDVASVPFLPGALEYARAGAIPGGTKNNREFVSSCVEIERELAPEIEALLYDPQTSGGLLISGPAGLPRGRHRSCDRATKQTHSPSMNYNPIIIALDVESADQARRLVDGLGDTVDFYKVGLELYAAAGMTFVDELISAEKEVFLDLKFHDIGETVKRAVAVVARRNVRFLDRSCG